MSYGPTSYDPPPPKPGELAPAPFEMQYLQAYNYIMENPNWLVNILCLMATVLVGSMIPFVGGLLAQLVIFGYQFEVIESLCRTQGRRYPDFLFDRLGDYFTRGIWPFLVSMIASLVFTPIFLVLFFVPFFALGAMASSNQGGGGPESNLAVGAMILVVSVMVLMMLVFSLGISLLMIPMTLRAGLTQDFAEGFKFAWVWDFVKKTWVEIILATLFIMATGLGLVLLGILACFVGVFFTAGMLSFAQFYMLYQYYQLYLSRGGEPIVFKTPPLAAVMAAPTSPFPPQ